MSATEAITARTGIMHQAFKDSKINHSKIKKTVKHSETVTHSKPLLEINVKVLFSRPLWPELVVSLIPHTKRLHCMEELAKGQRIGGQTLLDTESLAGRQGNATPHTL